MFHQEIGAGSLSVTHQHYLRFRISNAHRYTRMSRFSTFRLNIEAGVGLMLLSLEAVVILVFTGSESASLRNFYNIFPRQRLI